MNKNYLEAKMGDIIKYQNAIYVVKSIEQEDNLITKTNPKGQYFKIKTLEDEFLGNDEIIKSNKYYFNGILEVDDLFDELLKHRKTFEVNCAICGYSKSDIYIAQGIDNILCEKILELNPSINVEYNEPVYSDEELDEIIKDIFEAPMEEENVNESR